MLKHSILSKRVTVFDNALAWLYKNLDHFSIRSDANTLEEDYSLKALNELVFFSALYKRKYGILDDDKIKKFISFAAAELSNSNYLDKVIRNQESFLAYAGICEGMLECGIEIKGLRDTLKTVVNQGYVTSAERVPFKIMDLRRTLHALNIEHNLTKFNDIFRKTLLYKDPPLPLLHLQDAYIITHTIFYLADFGLREIFGLPSKRISAIQNIITSLAGIYLYEKNWDILAELLICCYCLRWFPYPLYEIAWDSLLNVQRSDGSIPGPRSLNEKMKETASTDKTYFEQNYHTTLVTALACFIVDKFSNQIRSLPNQQQEVVLPYKSLRVTCRRSHHWISSVFPDLSYRSCSYQSLLYLLLSEWIFYNAIDTHNVHLLYHKIGTIKDKLEVNCPDAIDINSNLILILLSTAILNRLNLESQSLQKFAKKVTNVLHKYKAKTNIEEISLFTSRFLSQKIDSQYRFYHDAHSLSSNEIRQIYADKNLLHCLSNYVSERTAFGRRRISLKCKNNLYLAVLSLLLHSLCEYQLDKSFLLMRTLVYLGIIKTKSFKQCLDFIMCQERTDGRLGYFGIESSQLRTISPQINVLNDLYLPVTVSGLWTIAEIINPYFRLFDSI